jgi:hypothetical protein
MHPVDIMHLFPHGLMPHLLDVLQVLVKKRIKNPKGWDALSDLVKEYPSWDDGHSRLAGFAHCGLAVETAKLTADERAALHTIVSKCITATVIPDPALRAKVVMCFEQLDYLYWLVRQNVTPQLISKVDNMVPSLMTLIKGTFGQGMQPSNWAFPKFHALLHLADNMRLYGPLRFWSMARFELAHKEIKRLALRTSSREDGVSQMLGRQVMSNFYSTTLPQLLSDPVSPLTACKPLASLAVSKFGLGAAPAAIHLQALGPAWTLCQTGPWSTDPQASPAFAPVSSQLHTAQRPLLLSLSHYLSVSPLSPQEYLKAIHFMRSDKAGVFASKPMYSDKGDVFTVCKNPHSAGAVSRTEFQHTGFFPGNPDDTPLFLAVAFFAHDRGDPLSTEHDFFVVAQEYAAASPVKIGLAAESGMYSLRTLKPGALVIRPVHWIHKLVHAMPVHPMAAQPWDSVWYASRVR